MQPLSWTKMTWIWEPASPSNRSNGSGFGFGLDGSTVGTVSWWCSWATCFRPSLLENSSNASCTTPIRCQTRWGASPLRLQQSSEHCSGPSTSENGKIWQKSGFSPFWPHWSLCGWASKGCVHSYCCVCMYAVLS